MTSSRTRSLKDTLQLSMEIRIQHGICICCCMDLHPEMDRLQNIIQIITINTMSVAAKRSDFMGNVQKKLDNSCELSPWIPLDYITRVQTYDSFVRIYARACV
ncbi:hypothetical protein DMN91_003165 [Ooceraea biroi]|uniref:Uncharacterized protein n=1 Tax=Ooceraea biroi TaxID=2015173 RepID=A0A3L8DXW4_OOCBI|nr:hypothetical protein DMN91_003165 [Ooceraea biroi]